jgi:hypothetical protein
MDFLSLISNVIRRILLNIILAMQEAMHHLDHNLTTFYEYHQIRRHKKKHVIHIFSYLLNMYKIQHMTLILV